MTKDGSAPFGGVIDEKKLDLEKTAKNRSQRDFNWTMKGRRRCLGYNLKARGVVTLLVVSALMVSLFCMKQVAMILRRDGETAAQHKQLLLLQQRLSQSSVLDNVQHDNKPLLLDETVQEIPSKHSDTDAVRPERWNNVDNEDTSKQQGATKVLSKEEKVKRANYLAEVNGNERKDLDTDDQHSMTGVKKLFIKNQDRLDVQNEPKSSVKDVIDSKYDTEPSQVQELRNKNAKTFGDIPIQTAPSKETSEFFSKDMEVKNGRYDNDRNVAEEKQNDFRQSVVQPHKKHQTKNVSNYAVKINDVVTDSARKTKPEHNNNSMKMNQLLFEQDESNQKQNQATDVHFQEKNINTTKAKIAELLLYGDLSPSKHIEVDDTPGRENTFMTNGYSDNVGNHPILNKLTTVNNTDISTQEQFHKQNMNHNKNAKEEERYSETDHSTALKTNEKNSRKVHHTQLKAQERFSSLAKGSSPMEQHLAGVDTHWPENTEHTKGQVKSRLELAGLELAKIGHIRVNDGNNAGQSIRHFESFGKEFTSKINPSWKAQSRDAEARSSVTYNVQSASMGANRKYHKNRQGYTPPTKDSEFLLRTQSKRLSMGVGKTLDEQTDRNEKQQQHVWAENGQNLKEETMSTNGIDSFQRKDKLRKTANTERLLGDDKLKLSEQAYKDSEERWKLGLTQDEPSDARRRYSKADLVHDSRSNGQGVALEEQFEAFKLWKTKIGAEPDMTSLSTANTPTESKRFKGEKPANKFQRKPKSGEVYFANSFAIKNQREKLKRDISEGRDITDAKSELARQATEDALGSNGKRLTQLKTGRYIEPTVMKYKDSMLNSIDQSMYGSQANTNNNNLETNAAEWRTNAFGDGNIPTLPGGLRTKRSVKVQNEKSSLIKSEKKPKDEDKEQLEGKSEQTRTKNPHIVIASLEKDHSISKDKEAAGDKDQKGLNITHLSSAGVLAEQKEGAAVKSHLNHSKPLHVQSKVKRRPGPKDQHRQNAVKVTVLLLSVGCAMILFMLVCALMASWTDRIGRNRPHRIDSSTHLYEPNPKY